jgi:hypothetical protein
MWNAGFGDRNGVFQINGTLNDSFVVQSWWVQAVWFYFTEFDSSYFLGPVFFFPTVWHLSSVGSEGVRSLVLVCRPDWLAVNLFVPSPH